jgi:Domain of unknown function (DUF3425)
MSTKRSPVILSSSEKKRLRDRKAQATLREKRQNRIQELEDRVAFCKNNHGSEASAQSAYVQELLATVERLRVENNRLRERQERLRKMVVSWDAIEENDSEPNRDTQRETCSTTSPTTSETVVVTNDMNTTTTLTPISTEMPFRRAPSPSPFPTIASALTLEDRPVAHAVVNLPSLAMGLPAGAPAWCRVPLNKLDKNNSLIFPLRSAQQWFDHPELIAVSPVQPSPLDLLYGTERNFLANKINKSVRRRAMRDAECLALGHLVYNYSKWRASPTPATFARLASFQHPTQIQIDEDHMAGLDMVIWPQLRINVILKWKNYDPVELIDYLGCCVKVRWPWGKDMLERDADDKLQLRSEFQKVFMSVDGWGLTAEFIDRYPELLEGMDVEALRFEITLPSSMHVY